MTGQLRSMTSIYLFRDGQVLLLWRVGSRVVAPSWCGVGGHLEERELRDARAAALRELGEETGLLSSDLEELAMRYVTLRLKNGEVRLNYYFFAQLREGAEPRIPCNEGTLKWHDEKAVNGLSMPFTAQAVMAHYLREGRLNHTLYAGVALADGVRFLPLEEF